MNLCLACHQVETFRDDDIRFFCLQCTGKFKFCKRFSDTFNACKGNGVIDLANAETFEFSCMLPSEFYEDKKYEIFDAVIGRNLDGIKLERFCCSECHKKEYLERVMRALTFKKINETLFTRLLNSNLQEKPDKPSLPNDMYFKYLKTLE